MRCPVCQARFRGTARCSRCGADLTPLMRLAIESWRHRESARAAIAAGNWEQAKALAEAAQQTCRTDSGESLRILAGWATSRN
jgi:predicted amidophosphoribosyltransferase